MKTDLIEEHFLYKQIAGRLESLIKKGVFRTGEKLPSVRALSDEQGISISTAFTAYSYLEAEGFIEARPKSGYYVREFQELSTAASNDDSHLLDPKNVSVDEMIAMVYENMSEESVLHLSMAVPAPSLLPEKKLCKTMNEAIRLNAHSCINYENIQGNLRLRKQVARNSFAWGGNFTENDIITTQGCMEAVAFCLQAVTKPGDTVAIESPTYFGIFNMMKIMGLKVVEIPLRDETGINLDFLERAIRKIKIKACLFVTNFNNPTGSCMPDENKKRLVAMLAKRNIPLIEDDIYGDLYFNKTRPQTCKSFDKNGLVLFCTSVSKSLTPGYRVGWCIPGIFKSKVLNLKFMQTVSSSTPTQSAIGLFFETGRYDLHIRKLRKALYDNCTLYIDAIKRNFPGDSKITTPLGGYVLWIELNKKINAFELYQRAMKFNISIAPGQIFSTDARYENHIRISFGTPFSEAIENSLNILGGLMRDLCKSQ